MQFGGVASQLPPTVAALSDLARSDCTRTFIPSPTGNLQDALDAGSSMCRGVLLHLVQFTFPPVLAFSRLHC